MFENSAISDYNGEIDMITIDKEVIDSGLVHSCFYGKIDTISIEILCSQCKKILGFFGFRSKVF
jgi:hypothetical protein